MVRFNLVLSTAIGFVTADYVRVAFASSVGILRSMRSGKSIIPCDGGMWETEASGGVCP